jgi:hypothetical protein
MMMTVELAENTEWLLVARARLPELPPDRRRRVLTALQQLAAIIAAEDGDGAGAFDFLQFMCTAENDAVGHA